MSVLFGGIEAGGTKFVCAVGTGPDDLQEVERFETTAPKETIGRCIEYFQKRIQAGQKIQGLGIASFGPVDPNPDSPKFGYITDTPKPHWSQTDFVGPLEDALKIPIAFDTDVNVAAFGEHTWGVAQGLDTFLYITVGTGFGGGGLMNGEMMHGLIHPEMGHIRLPHDWERDPYPGHCPYHGDCLEGMVCGPAIEDRWKTNARDLPPDHEAWDLEAEYLSYGLVNFICTLSPQKVILGGGVMDQEGLLEKIQKRTHELLNNYIASDTLRNHIENYIVRPGLGSKAGVLGAIAVARHKHG
ncbi:MAG: fructokinase [Planctomyces sp.]|nr:fructokinase [Planctomyces sp.]